MVVRLGERERAVKSAAALVDEFLRGCPRRRVSANFWADSSGVRAGGSTAPLRVDTTEDGVPERTTADVV